jgi:hypothetical protein
VTALGTIQESTVCRGADPAATPIRCGRSAGVGRPATRGHRDKRDLGDRCCPGGDADDPDRLCELGRSGRTRRRKHLQSAALFNRQLARARPPIAGRRAVGATMRACWASSQPKPIAAQSAAAAFWTTGEQSAARPSTTFRSDFPASRTTPSGLRPCRQPGLRELRERLASRGPPLDRAKNPETGEIEPWDAALCNEAGGPYLETTVSGAGLRLLGVAHGPHTHRRFSIGPNCAGIEIFRNATRYITISGLEIGSCAKLPPIDESSTASSLDSTMRTRRKDHQNRMDTRGRKTGLTSTILRRELP